MTTMPGYFQDVQPVGRKVIRAAKAAGYMIGVRYEGQDVALKARTDHTENALMSELYACSSGSLFFYNPDKMDEETGKPSFVGGIYFIHVNGREDAIADYSDNDAVRALVIAGED